MVNTKWIKDDEIVTVTNTLTLMATEGDADVVWYRDSAQNSHIMLHIDFLEQYVPYETVYEYRYVYRYEDSDGDASYPMVTSAFYKNDREFAHEYTENQFQRIDFTKQERK